jgi:hypothetical protein
MNISTRPAHPAFSLLICDALVLALFAAMAYPHPMQAVGRHILFAGQAFVDPPPIDVIAAAGIASRRRARYLFPRFRYDFSDRDMAAWRVLLPKLDASRVGACGRLWALTPRATNRGELPVRATLQVKLRPTTTHGFSHPSDLAHTHWLRGGGGLGPAGGSFQFFL